MSKNRPTPATIVRRSAAVLLGSLALSACGVQDLGVSAEDAGPAAKPASHAMQAAAGDIRLELPIANPYSIPIGAFTAAEGADLLGCSEGRFSGGTHTDGVVSTTLTCDTGARSGTFVLSFEPAPVAYTATPETPEHISGPWSIDSGTGDFELLTGEGTMLGSGVFPFIGVERWFTGTISFSAPTAR